MSLPIAAPALAALLAFIAAAPIARAAPPPSPTEEERTTSPYQLRGGERNGVQRAERHERLAAAADAAGDRARAARHYAIACYARAELILDIRLGATACARARTLAREHHVVDADVYLLAAEGSLRAWSLDVGGAIAQLQKALTLGAGLNPDLPEGSPVNGAHFTLGGILIEAGQFDLARRELTYARDHCGTAGDSICVAFAEVWLCRLHTQLGDFTTARAACDAAQPASSGDVFVRMNLGWIRADLESALDRHDAALASLQTAWQAAGIRGGELLQPTLASSIADVLVTLGRLDEAERWQQPLEQARAQGLLPASYGPQIAMRRGQIAIARGRLDEAIAAFEIASGSPMHETSIAGDYALANARHSRRDLSGARAALERAIAKIEAGRTSLGGAAHRASYVTMHARAYGELVGVLWDERAGASAPQALELAEASRARALLDALSLLEVAGAKAPIRSAHEIAAMLEPDQALIEYVSTDSRLFAVAGTRDAVVLVPLPGAGDARALAARMSFFRQLVYEADRNDELDGPARRLYTDLVAPVVEALPSRGRGITTLVISPDGPLHDLPFDALLGPDGSLVDRWRIAIVPSVSVLAAGARSVRAAGAALVVAAPDAPGYDALPFTREEAAIVSGHIGREASTVLLGDRATIAAVDNDDLNRFALLHFAGHAITDEVVPLRSALLLAPAGGDDGRWRASAIYKLRLDADLVVLSACRTSTGTVTRGEGAMSLARAFLYSGARATVATQWDVDDAAGPAFASALYARLAAGNRIVDAVGDAKRELRRRGAPPRVWAAYALTGNPGSRVGIAIGVNGRRRIWLGAAGVVVALLTGFVVARRARTRRRRQLAP